MSVETKDNVTRPEAASEPADPVMPDLVDGGLSTLRKDGRRRWLTPKVSKGRFLSARRAVAYGLIVLFTALPYVKMAGKPVVLLDIPARRFTFFGVTFLPTDTLLLALLMVGVFLTVFFVTALFGRVWCGWGCPQTVYMEFVYRPIERLFEGAPGRAKRGWLQTSGAGKPLKYVAYLLVSLVLAHTFLAYFVGVDRLWHWVQRSPAEHPEGFLVVAIVTAAMMFDFAYFREQTCIVACPYGRFQSVMLDRQSMIVTYDRQRGEPRGKKAAKKGARGVSAGAADLSLPVMGAVMESDRVGDCVDCHLCVTTCPTGIDIRNGLQMECIGCAQCIDACDAVMTKIGRPRGLIRYSSTAAVIGEKPRLIRARVIVYPAVLAIVLTGFLIALLSREPADVTVLRGLGAPFTEQGNGMIENAVRIKVVNRTDSPATYRFGARADHDAAGEDANHAAGVRLVMPEEQVTLGPGATKMVFAVLEASIDLFERGAMPVRVMVRDESGFEKSVKYRMMGPGSKRHAEERHNETRERQENHDGTHNEQENRR
ncbi:MAG: cytochrome c oxidase accessory protein CcoG [Phycisphaerales bacterium]